MRSNELGTLDAYFDGVGDNYGFGTTAVISVDAAVAGNGNPFTFVAEAYLDSFVDGFPIIGHIANSFGIAFRFFWSNSGSYQDATFGFPAGGEWKFTASGVSKAASRNWVVVTFDGVNSQVASSWNIYVNGIQQTILTGSSLAGTTNETRIGGSSNTSTDWNGAIRQVRVYDRVWSHAEAVRFWHPDTRDSLFAPPHRKSYLFGVTAAAPGNPYWYYHQQQVLAGVNG